MTVYLFMLGFIVVLCFLLVMLILSQNPKGGGLSSTFGGGGTSMFGVQRTNDFLDKSTWTLSILIAVLIVLSTGFVFRPDTKRLNEPSSPDTEQSAPSGEAQTPASQSAPATGSEVENAPSE